MTSRSLRVALPLSAAALALAACADVNGPQDAVPLATRPRSVSLAPGADGTDGYLVFLKADAQAKSLSAAPAGETVSALAKVAGADAVQPLQFTNAMVVRGDVDVAALEADPRVERVTPNTLYFKAQTSYPTGATFYARGWQWNMRQIRANLAATNGSGRTVCVIDGGVNKNHQDLQGKVVAERAFPGTTPYAPDDDFDGHGSHVGSTVSTNGIGVAGVAPGARLMNANVFGPDAGTSVARIVDGMNWCVAQGADVINMSLGGARTRGSATWVADSTTYTNAAQAARNAGTVVIAAAGNNGVAIPSLASSGSFLPAEATGVIAVGATAPAGATTFPFAVAAPNALYDTRPPYSNFNTGNDALGPGVRIYAPGGANVFRAQLNITAACAPSSGPACSDGKRYFSISGTSMASPHVAGVAALISSRTAGARSLARVQAIEACLLNTADPLPGGTPFFGRGRLNAQRATTEPCPGL